LVATTKFAGADAVIVPKDSCPPLAVAPIVITELIYIGFIGLVLFKRNSTLATGLATSAAHVVGNDTIELEPKVGALPTAVLAPTIQFSITNAPAAVVTKGIETKTLYNPTGNPVRVAIFWMADVFAVEPTLTAEIAALLGEEV